MCPSVVVYVIQFQFQSQMFRSSWFEFTTAILGLMRKRASPCIKRGLNALQQWSTGGHWNYMLINVRQPFTVAILIMNTKLQILSFINRVGKGWFRERFKCGIWFRIKFFLFQSVIFQSYKFQSCKFSYPITLTHILSRWSRRFMVIKQYNDHIFAFDRKLAIQLCRRY